MDIKNLKAYHKNLRRLSEKQYKLLKRDLEELKNQYKNNDLNEVFIYVLREKNNKKIFYIGKTNNLKKRYSQHINNAQAFYKTKLYCYIRKLWKNNKDFEITKVISVNRKIWEIFEIKAIELSLRYSIDIKNMSNGGISPEMTIKTRKKISKSLLGRKFTKEHKNKLSIAKKGVVPWNKGKKTGQTSPMKLDYVRHKVSQKLKGRLMTLEWRKKLSNAKIGKTPWNKGKTGLFGKTILMIDKINNREIQKFNSITLATLSIKGSTGAICDCLKGRRNSAYGYLWKYS